MNDNYEIRNERWDITDEQCTVEKILKNVGVITKTLNGYQKEIRLDNLSRLELLDILYQAEKSALAIRKMLSKKEEKDLLLLTNEGYYYDGTAKGELIDIEEYLEKNKEKLKELDEKVFKNYYAECDFKDGLFTLYTPFTYKRGYRINNFNNNYLLSNYIRNSIIDWQKTNQISLINTIETPYIIILKRTKANGKIGNICDNDNLENQRIINEIGGAFNLYDSVSNMSLYTMFDITKEGEKEGMYFYIFSQKDLPKHVDLFKKQEKQTLEENTKNTTNVKHSTKERKNDKKHDEELSKFIEYLSQKKTRLKNS